MRRQKIVLVSEPKKEGSSFATILGSLTALLTILTATLYLSGYLFLTGYYGAFNLPVSLVAVPTQNVLAVSAVLLIPIGGIPLLCILLVGTKGISFGSATIPLSDIIKLRWFHLGAAAYLLILVFAIPPTGKWFANKQLTNGFSLYKPLAEPLPFVSLQSKQVVPGLPSVQTNSDGTVSYKNLRLIASNDKYFFLYSSETGTSLVPHDFVLWMGFYDQPVK